METVQPMAVLGRQLWQLSLTPAQAPKCTIVHVDRNWSPPMAWNWTSLLCQLWPGQPFSWGGSHRKGSSDMQNDTAQSINWRSTSLQSQTLKHAAVYERLCTDPSSGHKALFSLSLSLSLSVRRDTPAVDYTQRRTWTHNRSYVLHDQFHFFMTFDPECIYIDGYGLISTIFTQCLEDFHPLSLMMKLQKVPLHLSYFPIVSIL